MKTPGFKFFFRDFRCQTTQGIKFVTSLHPIPFPSSCCLLPNTPVVVWPYWPWLLTMCIIVMFTMLSSLRRFIFIDFNFQIWQSLNESLLKIVSETPLSPLKRKSVIRIRDKKTGLISFTSFMQTSCWTLWYKVIVGLQPINLTFWTKWLMTWY